MKQIWLFLIVAVLFGCKNLDTNKVTTPPEKWVNLLKGNSLKDWTIKITNHPAGENYKNTFRVKDGVLSVHYDEYEQFDNSFGHIFYNKEFSNYKFRMEYRFLGEQVKGGESWAKRNSGIMIHCEDPKNMAINQKFPVCIEVQLLGGLGTGDRPTGNVCTPDTDIILNGNRIEDHCINSSSKTYNGDQWVKVEIEVRNDSIITHKINGEVVMTYSKPEIRGTFEFNKEQWKAKEGIPLKKGFISLQSESHPVEFRNIEILEL